MLVDFRTAALSGILLAACPFMPNLKASTSRGDSHYRDRGPNIIPVISGAGINLALNQNLGEANGVSEKAESPRAGRYNLPHFIVVPKERVLDGTGFSVLGSLCRRAYFTS